MSAAAWRLLALREAADAADFMPARRAVYLDRARALADYLIGRFA